MGAVANADETDAEYACPPPLVADPGGDVADAATASASRTAALSTCSEAKKFPTQSRQPTVRAEDT